MMRTLSTLAVLVLALLSRGGAEACCMVPRSFAGDVDQESQRVTVLHHDGHQELVIRVAPYFQGSDDTPGYLAWVLTVPSKPTGYQVVEPEIFDQAGRLAERLEDLARQQRARRSRFINPFPEMLSKEGVDSMAVSAAGGLEVSAPIVVGPYEITEVKARGADALEALNAYLEEHEFPTEDPAHMRWFVENDFTFLCIYITPPAGENALGRQLDLKPLQVGFATERPYYPGMFSSRQGDFALDLTTITSAPLARASLASVAQRLRASLGMANLWTVKPLPDALGDVAAGTTRFADVGRWHVNRFPSFGFNDVDREGRPRIASWTEDVFFSLGGEADGPPDWYYGDRDIGIMERVWREHALALLAWLVLLLGLALWLRGRSARRAQAAR